MFGRTVAVLALPLLALAIAAVSSDAGAAEPAPVAGLGNAVPESIIVELTARAEQLTASRRLDLSSADCE
jgi:hypothetical protein